jgi:hypothetical protein
LQKALYLLAINVHARPFEIRFNPRQPRRSESRLSLLEIIASLFFE